MIVSVSRRTDIPAFYFDWFLQKLKQGFVEVPNPFNPKKVSVVSLAPSQVEAFVFWTKDPSSLAIPQPLLDPYPWIALITLTPYPKEWEKAFAHKTHILKQFQLLSHRVGKNRIVWRYDPIILTEDVSFHWHRQAFSQLARELSGYTDRCMVSFVTSYRKNRKFLESLHWKDPPPPEKIAFIEELRSLAKVQGIEVRTCADPHSPWPGACIDGERIERITGKNLNLVKDPYQREACLCRKSVDIGQYHTCKGGCLYCYAGSRTDSSYRYP
ncbi:MAG: DUF1848 domain-containing protein [Spirochaetales bacterium]